MRFDLPRLSRVRVDAGPDRRVDLGRPVTLSAKDCAKTSVTAAAIASPGLNSDAWNAAHRT